MERPGSTTSLAALLLATGVLCSACRCVSGTEVRRRAPPPASSADPTPGDDWWDGRLPDALTEGEPERGGELVVQLDTEPPSLNPILDADFWASQITQHRIYESLVAPDPTDHPRYAVRPELSVAWEVSADQRTIDFALRRDVKFHDGQPLTARDVIATFDKIRDPSTKAMHVRAYMAEVESYQALDDYRVRFRLRRPYFMIMDGLFSEVPIQPAHRIAPLSGPDYNESASNPLNRAPIGSGPFRLAQWNSHDRIILERNESYHGRAPYLERVVFRLVKDPAIALELAERGQLDVLPKLRAQDYVKLDERRFRPKFHRSRYYDANTLWIGYNQRVPAFADRRVRVAMTMLIDRQAINRSLLHGLGMETTCHFYYASDACEPNLEPLPFDPLGAVRLLEQAGYVDRDGDGWRDRDGRNLRFGFLFGATSRDAGRIGTVLMKQFERAGIELRLERAEWSTFTRRLREHRFDICTMAWVGGPRGDPTQVWHTSSIEGGSNFVSFSHPQADDLIERARVELDDDRRNQLLREFGRLLHAEQPYTWLAVRPRLSLLSRRVKGLRATLVGFRYEDAWLTTEEREPQGRSGV